MALLPPYHVSGVVTLAKFPQVDFLAKFSQISVLNLGFLILRKSQRVEFEWFSIETSLFTALSVVIGIPYSTSLKIIRKIQYGCDSVFSHKRVCKIHENDLLIVYKTKIRLRTTDCETNWIYTDFGFPTPHPFEPSHN